MRFKKKRILVTDDAKGFVSSMAVLLNKMGFNAIPAPNGHEALRLVRLMAPDLVMVDIDTPALDSLALLKSLKHDIHSSEMPFVILYEKHEDPRLADCRALGCADFLHKPINIMALHELLQKYFFMPMGQKRNHLRVSYDGRVTMHHKEGREDLYSKTLSEGGIFIRRKDPLPVGSEIGLTLYMDEDSKLDFDGIVIYNNFSGHGGSDMPLGMAVEFTALSPESSEALSSFIKKLLAQA